MCDDVEADVASEFSCRHVVTIVRTMWTCMCVSLPQVGSG